VEALAGSDDFPGAIDEQLPAVSKLPPLVACHADDPELASLSASAIRVTNNTPRAVDFGMVCTELLRAAIQGEPMASAIQAGIDGASDETRSLLEGAIATDQSVREASRGFGLHCDLGAGVPSLMHNLASTGSFSDAIRKNIYAGGDKASYLLLPLIPKA